MENDELLLPVTSRQDFAAFVLRLLDDLERRPEGWENVSLPRFLEAMSAYTQDIHGYYRNMDPGQDANEASWQRFADILIGASIYE